ncbi:unnamed protein product [Lymnaea stagnalis]|uniref:Uncharacterized protein n=1 Tax=Lymnaea stagnalis TaxID=6523 RepID=A0AAV2H5A4_LYMST
MWSVNFLGVLLLGLTSVQISDQKALSRTGRLWTMFKSRHARQVTDEPVTDSFPTTTPESEIKPYDETPVTYIDPPQTSPYPPPDPNDACGGCPPGDVCVEVYPPCQQFTPPPPPPECFEENPDPSIDCDWQPGDYSYHHCDLIPICVDYRYYSWYG